MTYEVPQYSHIGYGGIALHVRIIYPVHNIGDTHITAFGAAGWVSLLTALMRFIHGRRCGSTTGPQYVSHMGAAIYHTICIPVQNFENLSVGISWIASLSNHLICPCRGCGGIYIFHTIFNVLLSLFCPYYSCFIF